LCTVNEVLQQLTMLRRKYLWKHRSYYCNLQLSSLFFFCRSEKKLEFGFLFGQKELGSKTPLISLLLFFY
jgi:hypothetical protein